MSEPCFFNIDYADIEKRVIMDRYWKAHKEAMATMKEEGWMASAQRLLGEYASVLDNVLYSDSTALRDELLAREVAERLAVVEDELVEALQRIESTENINVARKEARDLRALIEGPKEE